MNEGLDSTRTQPRQIRVREQGHWRLLRRTVAGATALLLAQIPLRDAVQAGDPSYQQLAAGIPRCSIPARLSLLIDVLFVVMYVSMAWRTHSYVREKRPTEPTLNRAGSIGAVLVTVAAALDLAENAVLWRRFGTESASAACPSLSVDVLSPVMWTLWLAGVLLLFAVFVGSLRRLRPQPPIDTTPTESGASRTGTIICCSGGGIRSAAFSLGALQLLSEKGLYQKASAVIGVSGGGYLAAAFHVVRRSIRPGEPEPFASGTSELARLRRRTHYLFPSVAVSARGILALLYGVVVNLVLIGVLLRVTAWLLGWAIHEAGVLAEWDTGSAYADFGELPLWYWIAALGPLALIVGIFLVEVIVDRFHVPPRVLREEARSMAQFLIVPALLAPVLFLGVPWLLAKVNAYTHSDGVQGPSVAPEAVAGLETLLGTEAGVAAAGALSAILLALSRSAWRGFTEASTESVTGDAVARIAAWARTRLVPWLGTALLVVVGSIVLVGWTSSYANSAEWRGEWSVAWLCVALVLGVRVFTDATRTSLHPYYRERLASTYLVRRLGGEAIDYEYTKPMPYSGWAAAQDGGPELVVVAAANAFDREFVPADRNCVPFVFDPHRTGVVGDVSLPSDGLADTEAYERRADYRRRDVTVPGAIAISGAAFAPLTGRDYARTRPMRLLFAVVNARLGVWLPNPYWGTSARSAEFAERRRAAVEAGTVGFGGRALAVLASTWAHLVSLVDKPGPYRIFKEAFGRTSLYDRRLYVTDGGHYDELGLVEALRRRPEQVIVVDASNDRVDAFTRIGFAIATARMDLGVEVELDLGPMRHGDDDRAHRAWASGTATYPDGTTARVFVLKALLVPELPWDVEAYAARNADFPRRSTGDQLYGEFDFEAYRALGYHLACDLVTAIPPPDAT